MFEAVSTVFSVGGHPTDRPAGGYCRGSVRSVPGQRRWTACLRGRSGPKAARTAWVYRPPSWCCAARVGDMVRRRRLRFNYKIRSLPGVCMTLVIDCSCRSTNTIGRGAGDRFHSDTAVQWTDSQPPRWYQSFDGCESIDKPVQSPLWALALAPPLCS